jgi:tight adherence protein C
MIIFLSALVTALVMLILFLLYYTARRPQLQTRQHLEQMIAEAEAQRQAEKQQKTKVVPTMGTNAEDYHYMRELSFKERVLRPLMISLENWLTKFAPQELRAMMENMLMHLGVQEKWSLNRLVAGWVLCVAAGVFLALLSISVLSPLQVPQQIAILLLGVGLGAVIPFLLLQSAIQRRKATIRRQLPEFLDFLCVSVQAGLSFDGAVAKIVHRMKGPLTEEFRRMLRDMGLGMDRQRTLTQLANRCDLEEMYLFTASVIQAEHLGTSMSRTLKIQADNMRDRHRQAVRAMALKAPVKIIFPMVLFIFPAIFVMVVFPSALTLLKSLNQ